MSESRESPDLETRACRHAEELVRLVREMQRVAVAFSGGVDSAVVAKAAVLALGDDACAVTAVSPSLATGELEMARDLATRISIRHVVLGTDEYDNPAYRRNDADRCYFCKTSLYSTIAQHVPDCPTILNGANVDDQGDYRPGMRAAAEHRVRSPLIEIGLNKSDVRELAKAWQLPVWDKPAAPCLSSRLAYGVSVTRERLAAIDDAESFLRNDLGLRELRVRLEHNGLARIEVPIDSIGRVVDARERICERLRALGFRYITLDLAGFRSGSLNAVLASDDNGQLVDLQMDGIRNASPRD